MKACYFVTIFLFVAVGNYSQTIQIGVGAGSTIVTGAEFYTNDLAGNLLLGMLNPPEGVVFHPQSLGFSSEYNLNIKAKMLLPDLPISFYSDLSYNLLRGKGEVMIVNPVSSSMPPLDEAESKCNLFNASLGAELRVLNQVLTPYFDLGFVISYLGNIKLETADDYENYEVTFLKGGVRYGFEAGIGWDYKFSSNFLIGISSKFTRNNLLGKADGEKNLNTLRTNIYILYEL